MVERHNFKDVADGLRCAGEGDVAILPVNTKLANSARMVESRNVTRERSITRGPSPSTTLEKLTTAQVKELQQSLAALGYGLQADGILGPATRTAWGRFKASIDEGEPDGIGPGSVKSLQQQLDAQAAQGHTSGVPMQAVNLVKSFEGYRATAYDDGTGVWTIGWGTTVYPGGQHVKPGDTITEAQGITYLRNDLKGTVDTLATAIPHWSEMNDNQRSALISFGYNLGAGFYGSSGFNTISACLKERRWQDLPNALVLYSDPEDPNVHHGLLRRRLAEGKLWLGQGPYAA